MAYIFVRQASLAPSQFGAAIQWAVRVGQAAERILDRDITVMTPATGVLHGALWTFRVDHMGELEGLDQKLSADPEYQRMVEESRTHGYVTSLQDTIFFVMA